jgi:hypothetical protein
VPNYLVLTAAATVGRGQCLPGLSRPTIRLVSRSGTRTVDGKPGHGVRRLQRKVYECGLVGGEMSYHGHGGGSSDAHDYGGGDGGWPAWLIFLALALILWPVGQLIYHGIIKTVEDNHDKVFNQQDQAILAAKLTFECREVVIHHGIAHVGPRCPSGSQGVALVVMHGLPAGITLRASPPNRGQYYGQCAFLDSASEETGDGGGPILSTPTTVKTGLPDNAKISLPGNACLISGSADVQYIEVTICREGTSGSDASTSYTIRQIVGRINPWPVVLLPPGPSG